MLAIIGLIGTLLMLAASSGNGTLETIFWILLILAALAGSLVPDGISPHVNRGRFILLIILIIILGLKMFGTPS